MLNQTRALSATAVELDLDRSAFDLGVVNLEHCTLSCLSRQCGNGPRRRRERVPEPERGKTNVAARLGVHLVAALGNVADGSKQGRDPGKGREGVESKDDGLRGRAGPHRGPVVKRVRLEVVGCQAQTGPVVTEVGVDVFVHPTAGREPRIRGRGVIALCPFVQSN